MSTSFPLTIVSSLGLVYDGECEELYCPAETGPLGILPGHTPYIASIASRGILSIKNDGKTTYYLVYHGALEVKPDKVLVIVERALAYGALEEAEKALEDDKNQDNATSPAF